VVIGVGGLGELGPEAWDFEGRQWVPLFEGEYAKAKVIMAALDSAEIDHRLSVPATDKVVVEVRRKTLAESRQVAAGVSLGGTVGDEEPESEGEAEPGSDQSPGE
jgi:hypothetical protein